MSALSFRLLLLICFWMALVLSIPNVITLGRLLAVPVAVWLILDGAFFWAFWLFVAAGVSDALDGFIARVFAMRTELGGYLDPLADKALLVCVYLALGHEGHLPLWLVILVVARDVMIIGGVLLLYTLRTAFGMEPLPVSKINTAAQIALAACVLANLGLSLTLPVPGPWNLIQVLSVLVGITTLLSGAGYVIQGCRLLGPHGKVF